jgi:hypothetical protein
MLPAYLVILGVDLIHHMVSGGMSNTADWMDRGITIADHHLLRPAVFDQASRGRIGLSSSRQIQEMLETDTDVRMAEQSD